MEKIKRFFANAYERLGELNKTNRFYFLYGVLIIMMTILVLKLGHLTLVQGNYWEEISKDNRVKDIVIKAPRGNIYDRNGEVLAKSRASYVAKIFKDDFNLLSQEERNNELYTLSRILEEEGARFVENLPWQLNMFIYKDLDDYINLDINPDDYVIEQIRKHNLVSQFLRSSYHEKTSYGNYHFYVIQRAVEAMRSKGLFISIEKYNKTFRFINNDENREILNSYDLNITDNVYIALEEMLEQDDASLKKILEHPSARWILMDLAKDIPELKKVNLDTYGLIDERNFLEQKSKLSSDYSNITMETTAKEDFVEIVKKESLRDLLEYVKFDKDNNLIVPAREAIELLGNKGKKLFTYSIDESDPSQLKAKVHYIEGVEESTFPMDYLIDLLIQEKLLEDFITDENIKYLAQNINSNKNINPNISVTEWEYTSLIQLDDLYKKLKFEDEPEKNELYNRLIEYYELEDFVKIDQYNIIGIYDRMEKQGARRFEGINLCYHLTESGVSKIEENFDVKNGIEVGREPIRYYPNGKTGSHMLGYIGKIATEDEKAEFINNRGYANDDLIGKTGIEQSQESALVGTDGYLSVLVDSFGNRTETLGKKESKAGNNVYLSMDLDLQKEVEEATKRTLHSLQTGEMYSSKWGDKFLSPRSDGSLLTSAQSAATVVMDLKSGEILAMNSYPSFDPNLFSTGISKSDWESLFPKEEKNPLAPRPLYNIATQSAVQPGSTFKIISQLAALEKGIKEDEAIRCDGYVMVGNRKFGCWIYNHYHGTHGYETAREALRDSCNYYYYAAVLGEQPSNNRSLSAQLTVDDILNTARKLGLGRKTGIEIQTPKESEGILPDPQIKMSSSKAIFRSFLTKELKKYVKPSLKKSEEELIQDREVIISWMNIGSSKSRSSMIDELETMGYEAEAKIGKTTLVDKIKFDFVNQSNWTTADTMSVVIGQGQNAYTPIQMMQAMSTIANDGYHVAPTLIHKITSDKGNISLFENQAKKNRVELFDYEHVRVIREGLNMAANFGADQLVFNTLPFEVGVKSGTAEIEGKNPYTGEEYDTFAWMVGFAPYDDPEIAVATLIVEGGGSANCAPMVRDIMAKALKVEPSSIDLE